jgi:hypothetical protein
VTQRDRKIAALAEQVADLVRRLDAVEAELEPTRRAQRQAVASIVATPRRWSA